MLILLIFSGYIFGLFFHHFILYSHTKQIIYLYFSVYVLSLFLGILSVVDGMDGSLGSAYDLIAFEYEVLFLQIYHFCLIVFALYINEISRLSERLILIGQWVAITVVLGITSLLLGENGILATSVFVLIAFVFIVYVTLYAKYYGVKASRPFLWSLYPLFVISFAHILAINGFIPFTDDLSSEVVIGTIWHISTLSYLVSRTIQQLHDDHEQIKLDNLKLYIRSRNNAMGEMVANIAHQWKQPLNAVSSIQNHLQISMEYGVTPTYKELLDSVLTTNRLINHLGKTIDTFYGFLTHHNTDKTKFNPNDEIATVQRLTEYDFANTNISIKLDIQSSSLIYGNPHEFIHILLNLILNAKEILENREVVLPEIKITTASDNNHVLIVIADNGGGIKIEPIEAIFDRYVSTKAEGKGLGLYMLREMVINSFSGEISVKNTNIGAQFTLRFPLISNHAESNTPYENDLLHIQKLSAQIIELEETKQNLYRWAELFDHAHWAIAVHTGTKDTFESVNSAFYSLYGYLPEELSYLTVRDLFSPYTLLEFESYFEQAIREGHVVFESMHKRKNGASFPVSIELIVIKNSGGEILYYVTNVWDISTKHHMNETIDLLTKAINSTDEAIYINDDSYSILFVNSSACKMLGYSEEEFNGLKIYDIDAIHSLAEVIEMRKILKINESITFETKHRKKTGEIIDVEVVSNLFQYDDRLIGFSIVKDITERKEIENLLKKHEEQYRTLVENSNDNIIRYDIEGKIVYLNPALEKTLGKTLVQLEGKTPTDNWNSEYEEFEAILLDVIRTGESRIHHHYFTGPDGVLKFHHIKFIAERDSDNRIIGALVIGRDVSELAAQS